MLLLVCQKEKSDNNEKTQDVKGLIEEEQSLQVAIEESNGDISENESSSDSVKENTITVTESENVVIEEKTELDHEDNKNDLSKECKDTNSAVINVDALDTIENVEPTVSSSVKTENAQDFDKKMIDKKMIIQENETPEPLMERVSRGYVSF